MRNPRAVQKWREIDVLVIDEVSMMSADLFDKVLAGAFSLAAWCFPVYFTCAL